MKKYINFILAGILVVALAAIMVLIKNGGIVNFDNNVFNLVTTNENSFLENMYRVFTFLGSTEFIVGACLVIFVLFIIIKKKEIGFVIVGSVVISTIVNNVIKLIFRRERPLVRRLVEEKSFSFPSGHTMAAVTLYGILIFFVMRSKLNKTVKIAISIVLGLLPICVAVSRIYLGAHFASDVIGAAVTSSALLFIETYFAKKYYDKIVK
ncbi:MAG: phosphatase PAP2 family protein [Clostridia bacterium]|nr:phosphatase PAP2 family protein [Clostridia bacterium]